MVNLSIESQDRGALLSQLSVEIKKMNTEVAEAEVQRRVALRQALLDDACRRIGSSVQESIAKLDLNAVFRCRQIFSSIVLQTSTPSTKEQVLLELAISNTYRAMVWSGLNDALIKEQSYLRESDDAEREPHQVSGCAGSPKGGNELTKDWYVANGLEHPDLIALANAGLLITGAIISLALVIHDKNQDQGTTFASVWNPLVELFENSMKIRNTINSHKSPES